jgi:ABC-type amino acid transport substrate-binding protein
MLRFWIASLALIMISGTAAAADSPTLARIAETGEFRIGYVPDAPPLSLVDENEEVVGYSIDLCRHIASSIRFELGLEKLDVTFTPLVSIEDRLSAVENGDVDIECGSSTVTLSRRERVDFTSMTFITGSAVLSRKEKPITTIDDLDKKRIGVVSGTTTEDVLRHVMEVNDFRVKLTPVDDREQGMELLNKGKVDGFASDRAVLIGHVFRNANVANEYTMTRSALSFEPYAFMVRRGDTEFRLAADRALASLYRTARIRRIYHNWFGRYGEPLSPIVEAMYQFQAVGE